MEYEQTEFENMNIPNWNWEYEKHSERIWEYGTMEKMKLGTWSKVILKFEL